MPDAAPTYKPHMQIGSQASYGADPRPNAYRRGYGGKRWRGTSDQDGLGGLRGVVFVRDEGRCRECGQLCVSRHRDHRRRPSIDHIIPRNKGGSNDLSNLRLLCVGCNSAKRDRQMEESHP